MICVIVVISVNYYFLWLKPIDFKNISYELVDKNIKATITFPNNVSNGSCIINNQEYSLNNHQCIINLPNEETVVKVKTKWNEVSFTFDPKQDQVLDFELLEDKIYMIVGEDKEIDVTVDKFGEPDTTISLVSDDENIVKVDNNIIKAVGKGNTNVKVKVGNISNKNILIENLN